MFRLLGLTPWGFEVLREYEGPGAWWRLAAAVLLRCGPALLLLIAFGAGFVAGIHASVLRLIVCALVFLAATSAAAWTQRIGAWTRPTLGRLALYDKPNPNRFAAVLLTESSEAGAWCSTLRGIRVVPGSRFRQPPFVVADATFLWRMNVGECEAFPLSQTADDFVALVAHTLAHAGLRARVAYLDAFPDGTVERWDAAK